MTGTGVVFLFEPDARMLANHSLPLLRDDLALPHHGLELRPFGNRNELLRAIAAERRESIALIDLQLDDRRDHNWSGHRVIETIRMHRDLWSTCRPFAFTVHVNNRIVPLLEQHGAWGVVCRRPLEVPAEQRALLGFPQQLAEVFRQRTVGPERRPERFWVLPEGYEIPVAANIDGVRLRAAIRRVFNRRSDLSAQQWMILRYYADGLPKEAVAEYIEAEFGVTGDRAVERLQGQLRPPFRAHGPDLQAAAEDLFAQFPGKRPVPTEELTFRTMGRISTLMDEQIAPLVRTGYLDEEAIQVFWTVFQGYGAVKPGNAAGDHHQQQAIETILADSVGGDAIALRRARRAFVRAIGNLYDTIAATDAHEGEPSAG